MENDMTRICPLLAAGSLAGDYSNLNEKAVECMEEGCAWWDDDAEACGLCRRRYADD